MKSKTNKAETPLMIYANTPSIYQGSKINKQKTEQNHPDLHR